MPDRPVPAQWIEREAEHGTGHRNEFDQRQGQRIANQHIEAEFVEVGGHEGGACQCGAGCGDQQRDNPAAGTMKRTLWRGPLALHALGVALLAWCRAAWPVTRFMHRHQCRNRGKGQLKSSSQQSFRLQQNDAQSREGEVAHGQGFAVQQHRAKHDQGHDQRPLGADPRATEQRVGERPDHGKAGRPFSDRPLQGQRGAQAEQASHQPKQQAGHQTHLDAGDGHKMKNSGFADQLAQALIEHATLARDHGNGNGAALTWHGGQNIVGDTVAQPVERHGKALAHGRRKGRIKHFDAPQNRTDATKSGKKGVCCKIITARHGGMRGRQQAGLEGYEIPSLGAWPGTHGHPYHLRAMRPWQRIGAGDIDNQTCADRTPVDTRYIAGDFNNADVVQHRRTDPVFSQFHGRNAEKKQHQAGQGPSAPWMLACQPSQNGKGGSEARRIPEVRFTGGLKLGDGAETGRDGRPKEDASPVDFGLKTSDKGSFGRVDDGAGLQAVAQGPPGQAEFARPPLPFARSRLHTHRPPTLRKLFTPRSFTQPALMIHEGAASTSAAPGSGPPLGFAMTSPIVTRFAPSPTGFLHIGGARTALFNWLYARHHGGRFLLRIEDTDRERSTDAAIQAILDGLQWLGLESDGPPVMQFSRAARHREVAELLLASGRAYKCFATPAELDEMRALARAEGRAPRYDGRWRERDPREAPAGARAAIRLKAPVTGTTIIHDQVQGDVSFANKDLDDLVLLRSDGTPTYMLAVVVDDHDMGVTDIIRGDDHLTNAARQAQIYAALDWDLPRMAHIPLIHGPDGAKLSKRHGALGVEAYRDMGFLPAALRNYLVRLGWSAGDQEFFSTDEMTKAFTLEQVGRSAARFDFVKLGHVNGHYMRATPDGELMVAVKELIGHLPQGALFTEAFAQGLASRLELALPGLKERARTLVELLDNARFLYAPRPLTLDAKAAALLAGPAMQAQLARSHDLLVGLTIWNASTTEAVMREFAEAHDLKLGAVAQPLRAALTGSLVSPGVFDVMMALGRDESLARLQDQFSTKLP